MAQEIERKFRVRAADWPRPAIGEHILQGYLSSAKERIVRVRVAGENAWLTIKGLTTGATRLEFEYQIPVADAHQMIAELCERPVLEKIRYRIPHDPHVWEVDEFLGDNAGLLVAEIELAGESETFELPDWVGEEVTHDARYFNSNLLVRPYSRWA